MTLEHKNPLPSVDALVIRRTEYLTDEFADRVHSIVCNFPDELELSQIDHSKRRLKNSKSKYKGLRKKDEKRPVEWDNFLDTLYSIEKSTLLSVIARTRSEGGIRTMGQARDISSYIINETTDEIGTANFKLSGNSVVFFVRAFMRRAEDDWEPTQEELEDAKRRGEDLQKQLRRLNEARKRRVDPNLFIGNS